MPPTARSGASPPTAVEPRPASAPNNRGNIAVNENFQTSQPHIYAVGDVIGPPSLASAAYDQGRFAASHICGDADYRLVRDIYVELVRDFPKN